MEWDTAAGDAVLRGAGGHVCASTTTRPLAYGKPGWDNPFFIAYAPGVGAEMKTPDRHPRPLCLAPATPASRWSPCAAPTAKRP